MYSGVGIGGEYPLSAAITSESCSNDNQARNLAMVLFDLLVDCLYDWLIDWLLIDDDDDVCC